MKEQNKKGQIGIVVFFAVLIAVLVIGFFAVMVLGVVDFASDTVTPIMTDLGMVGDTNLSEAAEYSFGTANNFIQAAPWVLGFSYVMALVFTLVFIFIVGYNPHPAFIAFFIALMILMVFGAVIISNMYQDIYTGTDEIATRLQEQTLMSYMILYSPAILVIISIIGGILMFARIAGNTQNGGYGI